MPDAFTLAVFAAKLCVLAAALTSAGLGWAIALGGDLARRVRRALVFAAALAAVLAYALLLLTANAQLGGAWRPRSILPHSAGYGPAARLKCWCSALDLLP